MLFYNTYVSPEDGRKYTLVFEKTISTREQPLESMDCVSLSHMKLVGISEGTNHNVTSIQSHGKNLYEINTVIEKFDVYISPIRNHNIINLATHDPNVGGLSDFVPFPRRPFPKGPFGGGTSDIFSGPAQDPRNDIGDIHPQFPK